MARTSKFRQPVTMNIVLEEDEKDLLDLMAFEDDRDRTVFVRRLLKSEIVKWLAKKNSEDMEKLRKERLSGSPLK